MTYDQIAARLKAKGFELKHCKAISFFENEDGSVVILTRQDGCDLPVYPFIAAMIDEKKNMGAPLPIEDENDLKDVLRFGMSP